MGLLRTIAIIVIVYYVLKFISRYILPLFLKKMVDNVQKKYTEQQQQQNSYEGKVGETVIAKKPVEPKESNKDVGDYVDYEEVKDDK
jgi:bacteriorhodopsin